MTEQATDQARSHPLRAPCVGCGGLEGVIERRNGQACVFCRSCGRFAYNAPRTETGERQRSAMTVHNGIKPKVHAAVIIRAGRRCELCGAPAAGTEGLMVDHMLSVNDGLKLGLTEDQLNNIENLAALCPACNHGKGRTTLPLYLVVAIIKARTAGGDGDQ